VTDPTPRLLPGEPAPDFELLDDTGSPVRLGQFGGRRVLLYFYPAALTPGCTTQARDFRDNLPGLQAAGIDVVGISPDRPDRLAKFRAAEGLTFTLLSDPDRSTLSAYGAFGPKTMYGREVTGVIRSTVLVGSDGRVERALYNVKATGHVARLLRELGLAG
jgi:peroxiredoxin Q/BCP